MEVIGALALMMQLTYGGDVSLLQFLKDNPSIKSIVSSFAVARNEFENAGLRRVPAAFDDAKCQVKLRFNAIHEEHCHYHSMNAYYYRVDKTYKTNGHYKLISDSLRNILRPFEDPEDPKFDMDADIYFQDGPGGYSKGLRERGLNAAQSYDRSKPSGVNIVEDINTGVGAYLILKFAAAANLDPAMWTDGTADPSYINTLERAGRWAIMYVDNIVNLADAQEVVEICLSNAASDLPPAFARDWSLPQTIGGGRRPGSIEECACDDESS